MFARDLPLLAEVAAKFLDEAGLAVDEDVRGAVGEGERGDRLQERFADRALAPVEPYRDDTVRGHDLLFLRRAGHLDEGVHGGPRGIRSMATAMAGSALSSPANRCQSAVGSGA